MNSFAKDLVVSCGRFWGLAALYFFAAFLTNLGSCAYGEPGEGTGISFSIPYDCTERELIKRKGIKTFCLTDTFKSGLNVVIVDKQGNCRAKTAGTFTDDYAINKIVATRLGSSGRCSVVDDEENFSLAVVGVDPGKVEVVEPQEGNVPQFLEMRARRVAKSPAPDPCDSGGQRCLYKYVADSPPAVFRAGEATLLVFKYTEENFNDDGPLILVIQNEVFRLGGTCIYRPPFFFTVNNKMHLAYWATVACCGCGNIRFFVYNLSNGPPRLVYENDDFAN
jgi:hypothetical protein